MTRGRRAVAAAIVVAAVLIVGAQVPHGRAPVQPGTAPNPTGSIGNAGDLARAESVAVRFVAALTAGDVEAARPFVTSALAAQLDGQPSGVTPAPATTQGREHLAVTSVAGRLGPDTATVLVTGFLTTPGPGRVAVAWQCTVLRFGQDSWRVEAVA